MTFKNQVISSLKTVISTVLLLLANIAAVFFVDYISTDFTIGPHYNAVIIVVAFAVGNAIILPIFRRFLMKFIIFTFGVGALFLNSLIFYMATYFIPGVYVGVYGFWQVPIVMAIATTFSTT